MPVNTALASLREGGGGAGFRWLLAGSLAQQECSGSARSRPGLSRAGSAGRLRWHMAQVRVGRQGNGRSRGRQPALSSASRPRYCWCEPGALGCQAPERQSSPNQSHLQQMSSLTVTSCHALWPRSPAEGTRRSWHYGQAAKLT